MRIFVINAYEDRKYKYDDKRYELYPAIWWENVTEEKVDEYHFRWNAGMDYRKKVVACSESHKNLLQKIVDEKLEKVIILEDDAVISDWDRFGELDNINEFCYVGGNICSPLLKDLNKFIKSGEKETVKSSFQKGINTIDKDIFLIGHACGYYIPNPQVAQDILNHIPTWTKYKVIDNEYMNLQKRDKIKLFLYPAIVTLNVPDAKKGFSYSTYKLYDNQQFY